MIQLPPSAQHTSALPVTALPDRVVEQVRDLAGRPEPVSAYLYDPDRVADRARRLRALLPDWIELCYAVKANSFPPVVAALARGGVDGFEVASVAEADLAQAAGAAAGTPDPMLVASGPAKHEGLLDALVARGVDLVNVESELELRRLSRVASRRGTPVRVALRVNPDQVPVTGSLQLGGVPTQFGVPQAALPTAIATARELPGIDLVGLHVHAVCQNLDAVDHAAYVRWCLAFAADTADRHEVDVQVVDVGGGLGVAFDGEAGFDVERFGAELDDLDPGTVRVVLEPGRWLVADGGWYAAEVVDVKEVHGTCFVLLRGGINHFQLPTSWDVVHPFAVVPVDRPTPVDERPEAQRRPVTVVGELCTSEDTLVRDLVVERVRVGDVVVFPNAGAYGWEFAMPRFLGHPPARRVAVTEGDPGQVPTDAAGLVWVD